MYIIKCALASVAQFVVTLSHNQKVVGSFPGQGTYLGCRFHAHPVRVQRVPSLGAYKRQLIDVSLSH